MNVKSTQVEESSGSCGAQHCALYRNRRKKSLLMHKKGLLPLRFRRNVAHLLTVLRLPSIQSVQEEILLIQQQQRQMIREQRLTCNVKRLVLPLVDITYTAEAIPAEILEDGEQQAVQQQQQQQQTRFPFVGKILQGDDLCSNNSGNNTSWNSSVGMKSATSSSEVVIRMSEEQKRTFLKTRYSRMKIAHRNNKLACK